MKLCCKCFSLWPREALYCGRCRKPLGANRCLQGHANPLRSPALTCLTCNQGPLEEGVPTLPLSGLASLASLLILVVLSRWAWHHPGVIACAVWRWGAWTIGMLFAIPPRHVQAAIMQMLTWYGLLWLLSYLLPGGMGRNARQTLRTLPRLLASWLRSALKALRPLVLPARSKKSKAASPPKDRDAGS